MNIQSIESIDHECVVWLRRFDIESKWVKRASAIQPARLAAYAFPRVVSSTHWQLCTDLIAWLFLFDDAFADGVYGRQPLALAREHARYFDLLAGASPTTQSSPWHASLADLMRRFEAMAPSAWYTRLKGSILRYFSGCEEECTFREAHRWPTLHEYLGYRDGSIGVYPMLDLIEFSNEMYLSHAELSLPAFEPLRRLSNLAIAVTNDIFSSAKESTEDDSFNAVGVLARERGLAQREALDQADALHRELRMRFEQAALRATSVSASPALANFVTGVEEWFDGNVRWSSECPRYNSHEALP
jgi:Terpene synthase family 2, C-terminal metal binding